MKIFPGYCIDIVYVFKRGWLRELVNFIDQEKQAGYHLRMGYYLTRFLIFLILRLTTRLSIQGFEKLPKSGSYIITANHLGRLDPALVFYFLKRRDVIIIVAEKYGKSAILRWFVRQLDGIFVDRYGADFGVVREVLNRLRRGGVLVLAPEGTRSPSEALIEGKDGASFLASKAGVPIYPVAVTGTEDRQVYAGLKRLRRARVILRIGDPFRLSPLPSVERDQALKTYTTEIMCQIAALLPEEYRGVYADQPRVRELIQSKEQALR